MKLESKFWHELKRITPQITWTRIENTSLPGTPDLLGYNANGHYFTVELKVTKSNSVRFSPHQIAYHTLHPKNSFILVQSLAASTVILYEGKQIKELDAWGLELEACCLGLETCGSWFAELGA
jgi:RecB family endonuclease NucS